MFLGDPEAQRYLAVSGGNEGRYVIGVQKPTAWNYLVVISLKVTSHIPKLGQYQRQPGGHGFVSSGFAGLVIDPKLSERVIYGKMLSLLVEASLPAIRVSTALKSPRL